MGRAFGLQGVHPVSRSLRLPLIPESAHRYPPEKICMSATFETQAPSVPEPVRRLHDDVLQSAEEAVLANPASAAVLTGPVDPQLTPGSRAGGLSTLQNAVAGTTARQPFAATLVAFGAGAVGAALLRSFISRRRNRS